MAISRAGWTEHGRSGLPFPAGIGGDHGVEEFTMTCVVCGAAMTTRREQYRYTESGLGHVVLHDVQVHRCPQCGEVEVAIVQIEALHQAITQALIRKPARLVPEEMRYLRTYLGWSGADFAAYMGTTPETVSRWEHGMTPMGKTADRLLRLIVATHLPGSADVRETLRNITVTPPSQGLWLDLSHDEAGWHAVSEVVTG